MVIINEEMKNFNKKNQDLLKKNQVEKFTIWINSLEMAEESVNLVA